MTTRTFGPGLLYAEEVLVPEGLFVNQFGQPVRMVREVPIGTVIEATIRLGEDMQGLVNGDPTDPELDDSPKSEPPPTGPEDPTPTEPDPDTDDPA